MADSKTDQEPSIEEILESIRQIISEDGTPVEAAPPAPKPAPAKAAPMPPRPAPVPPPPPPAPKPPEPAAVPAPVQNLPPLPKMPEPPAATLSPLKDDAPMQNVVLDLTDKVVETPEIPRIALEDIMEDEDHLVSDNTADAAVAAMMKLLANNIALERELPGKPGPVTLEDMARELMRPLIKQWLDQNLQHIIEKMVAREIERLSARALDQ